MKRQISYTLLFSSLLFLVLIEVRCNKDGSQPEYPLTKIENTLGFGILDKVKGIWDGPVTSTTPLGDFPEWIVDFRPISENQISAKNELDTLNSIHLSFFIAKYNNEFRVCFRNGGSFGGQTRVSYFLADSVSQMVSQSYYRFSEIIKGKNRAYTEVVFRKDSLIMQSFTNRSNTLSSATLHMTWKAKHQDSTSCQDAIKHFLFPKKTLTKDFSTTFNGRAETIYYSIGSGDPYSEADQPYLGQATINYSYLGTYSPNPTRKVFIMLTTEPLIAGISFITNNLKYRSRYVILAANDRSFVFNYLHPGTYFLYALYDADGNNAFSPGDWVSTSNTNFQLPDHGTVTASTQINFTIP